MGLKSWLENRKQKAKRKDYRKGFLWAIGAIHFDKMKPSELEEFYDCPFDYRTSFNNGAEAGVNFMAKNVGIEDDRICTGC